MEILPSEYQSLELTRNEKIFIRCAQSSDAYGYMLLNENPSMRYGEKQHIIICEDGVIVIKFWDDFKDQELFDLTMSAYYNAIFSIIEKDIYNRLLENKMLCDTEGRLKFGYNYVCIFPNISKINSTKSPYTHSFVENHCFFKEDMHEIKRNFVWFMSKSFEISQRIPGNNKIKISDENINSILNRLAVGYTISRRVKLDDEEHYVGADEGNLIIDSSDQAARVYNLDADQINMVNKISKGDQLILACAGSGKSVLLIAKCFKAASMNPTRKFLITCYSKKLMSLYRWYIDRAGFRERNVQCFSFHKLLKAIAKKNGCYLNGGVDEWPDIFAEMLRNGQIKTRYYGIFIDEIQIFEPEWYKICYNLLENKKSDDHLFVICGDKTQDIKRKQKHGRAPWNVGEGYPNYRGGNKSLRIEKNYRNCIEINDFINGYADNAKEILSMVSDNKKLDQDLFLRGKAQRHGIGVFFEELSTHNNIGEAHSVVDAVKNSHDNYHIPYDEIAIVIYNRTYKKYMQNWEQRYYNLVTPLLSLLQDENIPHSVMYDDRGVLGSNYEDYDGVALISFDSVLGLDFRTVIICGLKPFGDYYGTKKLKPSTLNEAELDEEQILEIEKNINFLYVACTRARDALYIIAPESPEDSMYIKLLETAYKKTKGK